MPLEKGQLVTIKENVEYKGASSHTLISTGRVVKVEGNKRVLVASNGTERWISQLNVRPFEVQNNVTKIEDAK